MDFNQVLIQVVAEEEQQFLSRQQQFLSQGLPPQQSGAMPTGDQHSEANAGLPAVSVIPIFYR